MIHFQAAKCHDAPQLTALARAAKAYWNYPQTWLERWDEEISVFKESFEKTNFTKLLINEQLIGFFGIQKGIPLILEGFWIHPKHIGKGYGQRLFQRVVYEANKMNSSSIEWESDPNATGFYQKMGAIRIGERVYGMDGQVRILPIFRYHLN